MTEGNHIPRIASDSLVLGSVIGRGSYGCVYEGKLQGVTVAVKQVLTSDTFSERMVQNELKFLVRLRYCNFVCQVIGYNYTNFMLSIVMTLAENGDLQQYLRSGNLVGDWSKKARICSDIARAVDLVHAAEIVHKDLKTKNILLDKFLTPKLTNFSLSKKFTSLLHGSGPINNLRYISPERFKYSMKIFTDAEFVLCDNYCYGLVLWEVATDGMTPYDDMTEDEIFAAKLRETNSLEYVGKLPADTPLVFLELIKGFLDIEPSKRPLLKSAQQLLDVYIVSNPSSFPSPSGDEFTAMSSLVTEVIVALSTENPFNNCDLFDDNEVSAFSEVQQILFKGAQYYYRNKKNEKTFEYLRKSELQDIPLTQRALGLCYQAIGEEYEAFLRFKDCAISDHKGQFYLAWCFEHGYGTKQDKVGALILYALAAAFRLDEAETALHNAQLTWCIKFEGQLTVGRECMNFGKSLCVNTLVIDNVGRTLLHWTAENGHANILGFLVSQFGADINVMTKDGRIPLHWAAAKGHVEVVELLVAEFGADVSAKDKNEWTPMRWAVWEGHVKIVRLFAVEFGVDVNAKDKDGWAPMHWAAVRGHVEVVRLLAAEFGADVNAKDKDGWTPLHKAAKNGHVEVVRLLVAEFGEDVNTKNNIGSTPMHWAANGGHIEVMKLLAAEFGADVNAKDNTDGSMPIHWAAKESHIEVVKMLVAEFGVDANAKDNDGWAPMHWAAVRGHIAVVKLLAAEFGADVNARENTNGSMPIHWAAKENHVEAVRMLVAEFGVDAKANDKGGWAPMHWAAVRGHVDVVRLLVTEFGANINAKDKDGSTPMHWAAKNGHVEVVRLLVVEFGADVNAKDKDGSIPIHRAMAEGHVEVVRLLAAEFGEDVNTKDEKGWTPMHWAANGGHVEVVRLLVTEFAADVNAKDKDGMTPMQLAAAEGHTKVVRLLAEVGADVNVKDYLKWSFLEIINTVANIITN